MLNNTEEFFCRSFPSTTMMIHDDEDFSMDVDEEIIAPSVRIYIHVKPAGSITFHLEPKSFEGLLNFFKTYEKKKSQNERL